MVAEQVMHADCHEAGELYRELCMCVPVSQWVQDCGHCRSCCTRLRVSLLVYCRSVLQVCAAVRDAGTMPAVVGTARTAQVAPASGHMRVLVHQVNALFQANEQST